MKASELLRIYRRRQSGYGSGLLKYGADIYERICCLSEHVAQLPPDTETRIQSVCARTVFSVAETGTELAAFPEDASIDGKPGQ